MCTLIAFHRAWEEWPLVVAANRDEEYGRPASGPAWSDGDPRILAPRDERAGGTWMGANERGLWIGLTNRRGDEGPVDGRRSRGLLCLDLLAAASVADLVGRVEALREPYDPYHLLAADGEEAALVVHEGERTEVRRLDPGVHLVTNRPPGDEANEPKALRARALLERAGLAAPEGPAPEDLEVRLAGVLADHGRRGPDAVCLHGGRYGTRSAAVWRVRPAPGGPAAILLAFADGPPCAAPFRSIG